MKRILLCSPYEIAHDNNAGGIVMWTRNIMHEFRQNPPAHIQLDLLSVSRKTYIHENVSLFRRLVSGIIDYSGILTRIKRQLKETKYDGLHLSSSASISLIKDYIILNYSKKKGIKTFIHFHFGRIPMIIKQKGWEYRMLMKVCHLAHQIIVMDTCSFKVLNELGFKNVTFLPNPVSSEINDVLLSCNIIERQRRKILFVGHMIKEKGIFELIEACKKVDNIELVMIGKVEPIVQQQIDSKYPHEKWLHLLGALSHKQVIEEMLKCGIFVLPSYTEGFPNVILEAMACSCPIVSTNVGAIPEMLDSYSTNNAGIIIPPRDTIALKEALIKLLKNENLSNEISENAYKKVNQEYTSKKVFNQLCNIWEK